MSPPDAERGAVSAPTEPITSTASHGLDDLTATVRQKCVVADLRYAFRCRPEPWRRFYPRSQRAA